jgi:hypothetical protein
MSKIDIRPPQVPFFGFWEPGQVYWNGQSHLTTVHATNLNQLRCSPLIVPNHASIAKIGAEISTVGSAGSVIRLGIFANLDGGCYPGDLILDAGTIDGTSQTVQDITLAALLELPPGLYWTGFASQVATCQVRAHASQTYPVPISPGTAKPSANATGSTYVQTGVSGALPSTFTSSRSVGAAGSAARIHLTLAA